MTPTYTVLTPMKLDRKMLDTLKFGELNTRTYYIFASLFTPSELTSYNHKCLPGEQTSKF